MEDPKQVYVVIDSGARHICGIYTRLEAAKTSGGVKCWEHAPRQGRWYGDHLVIEERWLFDL